MKKCILQLVGALELYREALVIQSNSKLLKKLCKLRAALEQEDAKNTDTDITNLSNVAKGVQCDDGEDEGSDFQEIQQNLENLSLFKSSPKFGKENEIKHTEHTNNQGAFCHASSIGSFVEGKQSHTTSTESKDQITLNTENAVIDTENSNHRTGNCDLKNVSPKKEEPSTDEPVADHNPTAICNTAKTDPSELSADEKALFNTTVKKARQYLKDRLYQEALDTYVKSQVEK